MNSDIEIGKLAGAFGAVTQCYKFVFFRSILALVRRGHDDLHLSFDDLLVEMVSEVWWVAKRYHLRISNSGDRSGFTGLIEKIGEDFTETMTPGDLKRILAGRWREQRADGVLRYVPERFLRPWFPSLKGADTTINRKILDAGTTERQGLPYRIVREGIELDPQWRDWLLANLPMVAGWAENEWLAWLQARNPGVVVTGEKLGPPSGRLSLAEQRKFIAAGMAAGGPLTCIYTGEPLTPTTMALDHFVPRSFVGHDRIWNLAPASKAINSSKGARLPKRDLLDRLIDVHHRIVVALDPGVHRWARWWEEYTLDLHLPVESLTDRGALSVAYRGTLLPQMAQAANMGFPEGWPP